MKSNFSGVGGVSHQNTYWHSVRCDHSWSYVATIFHPCVSMHDHSNMSIKLSSNENEINVSFVATHDHSWPLMTIRDHS